MRALADEYHAAAAALAATGPRRAPLSSAPYRLVAIQAIELYLNAFLLERGHDPVRLRGLQHDLTARASLALEGGLMLRRRTLEHIAALHDRREYLTARYDPVTATAGSRCNRVAATLAEVARKTGRAAARCPERAGATSPTASETRSKDSREQETGRTGSESTRREK